MAVTCRVCRVEKPTSEFFPSTLSRRRCKQCVNKATKRRRKKYAGLGHNLTKAQWEQILEAWGHRCAYCNAKDQRGPMTKDCVVPKRKKGAYTLLNVVPACQRCNSIKAGKSVARFLRQTTYTVSYETWKARADAIWASMK